MAPNGASLKQFNSVINRKEPNPLDMTTIKGTRQDSVSVFNAPYTTYNGMPNVNWCGYNTYDPIAYNACSSLNQSTSSADENPTNWLAKVMGAISIVTVLTGLVKDTFGLFRGNKSDKAADTPTDSNLSSLVEDANNTNKKTSKTELQNIATNLTSQIQNAERNLNTAKRDKETAQNTATRLAGEKTNWSTQLSDFDSAKSTLESDILSLESQIDSMPDGEAKTQAKAQLQEKKNQLKTDYSDAKRKKITDQIDRLDTEIKKWEIKKAEAQDKIDNLPSEIKSAKKALEKINKKINKD